MAPTEAILGSAGDNVDLWDVAGRKIIVHRLTALDKLRLLKAAGPTLSENQAWLGMAWLACAVLSIDDVPVPFPSSEHHIEATVARLGDHGIDAVADYFARQDEAAMDLVQTAGN